MKYKEKYQNKRIRKEIVNVDIGDEENVNENVDSDEENVNKEIILHNVEHDYNINLDGVDQTR